MAGRGGVVNRLPAINKKTFEGRAREYSRAAGLFAGECQLLEQFRSQFCGRVLDIAIGAGRTTAVLQPCAGSYVGIDFARSMIENARRLCPGADLRLLDMREVPQVFAGDQLDAILISFNGIDCISWDSRERLLLELRPLLAPGGVLVFSTHDLARAVNNRRFRWRNDLRLTPREILTRPRRVARSFVRGLPWFWRSWRNHVRYRAFQSVHDGFAVVNDDGDEFGLLTIYVSRARQLQQLAETGWRLLAVVPATGGDEPDYMHYYAAESARPQ